MKKYTEQELAEAISDLIAASEFYNQSELDILRKKHPVIDEICEFGPDGPCGMGLGNYGAHAVGD